MWLGKMKKDKTKCEDPVVDAVFINLNDMAFATKECPYFVTFVKINATLFLLPFSLRRSSKTGEFILHQGREQRVVCMSRFLLIM